MSNLKAASEECSVCTTKAEHFCGGCRVVRYCSREHQKADWKNHKTKCFPCRIEANEVVGRYLVASRNIKAGEIIFIDSPIVIGPKQVTEPICLSCFTNVDGSYNCTQCGWPLCGPKCQAMPVHLPECTMSQKRESKIRVSNFGAENPMYECITPLRCLWLRANFPDRWGKVLQMEGHTEKRKKSEKYKLDQINVVDFIRNFLKQDTFDDDLIHFVCGLLEVNCFEIPGPGIIGLYPFGCLLEHSCIPNTMRTFNSRLQLVVKSATDIQCGHHITTNYTDTLWGIRDRKLHLIDSKYFVCSCNRCKDPTDFGTHLNSIHCKACQKGLLPPPEDSSSPWKCNNCDHSQEASEVDKIVKSYGERLILLRGRLGPSEKFLKESKKELSENHQYRCEVKLALAQMYGRDGPNSLQQLSNDALQRKISLCKEILILADIFSPGLSRLRGTLLYELQASLCEQYRRLRKKQQLAERGTVILQEAEKALSEVVKILQGDSHLQDEVNVSVEAQDEYARVQAALARRKPT